MQFLPTLSIQHHFQVKTDMQYQMQPKPNQFFEDEVHKYLIEAPAVHLNEGPQKRFDEILTHRIIDPQERSA